MTAKASPRRPRRSSFTLAALAPAALAALLSAVASSAALAQGRTVSTDGSAGGLPDLPAELQPVRAALDKYRDPIVAVHDGYFSTVGCVEYPHGGHEGTMPYKPGGMGVHFLNVQLMGPTLDPAKPQVLIYEPIGDTLHLVAAEWFVPVQAAGGVRPAVFNHQLEGPMVGHYPLMPDGLHHYDLHVWLWKQNPSGVYAATNPALKCPKGSYSFSEAAPKLAPDEKQNH
jgi:hypothetical protein